LIGWTQQDFARYPSHTIGHVVFRIRRLNTTQRSALWCTVLRFVNLAAKLHSRLQVSTYELKYSLVTDTPTHLVHQNVVVHMIKEGADVYVDHSVLAMACRDAGMLLLSGTDNGPWLDPASLQLPACRRSFG
jgi:hypothetical protein